MMTLRIWLIGLLSAHTNSQAMLLEQNHETRASSQSDPSWSEIVSTIDLTVRTTIATALNYHSGVMVTTHQTSTQASSIRGWRQQTLCTSWAPTTRWRVFHRKRCQITDAISQRPKVLTTIKWSSTTRWMTAARNPSVASRRRGSWECHREVSSRSWTMKCSANLRAAKLAVHKANRGQSIWIVHGLALATKFSRVVTLLQRITLEKGKNRVSEQSVIQISELQVI